MFIFFIDIFTWLAGRQAPSNESALHKAMQALTVGRPRRAARMIRAQLKNKKELDPSDSHLLQQLALCTIKLWFVFRKSQQVDALFEEALALAKKEAQPSLRQSQLWRDIAEWQRKNGRLEPAREYAARSLEYLYLAWNDDEVANSRYTRELGATLGHLAFIEWCLKRPKKGVVEYWRQADEYLLSEEAVIYRLNAMVRGLKIDRNMQTADDKSAREVALWLATDTQARNWKRRMQIYLVCWPATRPFFAH